jgi:RimJ/RimL family protein N-acetyltransferase
LTPAKQNDAGTEISPVTLTGRFVRLEPLTQAHHNGLVEAVQDGRLWELWYTKIPSPSAMGAEIDRRVAMQSKGEMLPFAVIDQMTGRIVGMTTYLNMERAVPRLEIGATWYAQSAQRTPLNTDAKLLLLSHAFDQLACVAVEFRTHFLNQQSRKAIERLGAKLDGVLRHHMRMGDGTLRDTCVYSVLAMEWPSVRAGLEWQLNRPR